MAMPEANLYDYDMHLSGNHFIFILDPFFLQFLLKCHANLMERSIAPRELFSKNCIRCHVQLKVFLLSLGVNSLL